ncbi:MAG: RluA family pseudouridine synthase [Rhizobiaceae bacterium]|nr:RluA family pseudouridine synthase [Rhizobiaceae bacterium]
MNDGPNPSRPPGEGQTELIAGEDAIKQRLDAFVTAAMPSHVSRSRIKALIKQGNVTVNGTPNREPNYRLKLNDKINLQIPEPDQPIPQPENIPLEVLFEDDHLIVINKPAGMVVHPAPGNWSGTLVNALLHHCGDSLAGIGGVRRPGIVHPRALARRRFLG